MMMTRMTEGRSSFKLDATASSMMMSMTHVVAVVDALTVAAVEDYDDDDETSHAL
jgi:hypothetical protein